MKLYYRSADTVTIEGYVNAVERNSKPLYVRGIRLIERIASGAFSRAISRAHNIAVLLNHDKTRELGDTEDGSLELEEDNIGLKARFTTSDPIIVRDAKAGNLVGWSFGYKEREGGVEQMIDPETGLPLRKVTDLDLVEVSILNREKIPAYAGTLVEVRDDGSTKETELFYSDESEDSIESVEEESSVEEISPEEKTEERSEELPEAEAKNEEKPAPVVNEVSSAYYARYRDMIADMRKSSR